jgi:methylmalonic aciduria homocystinuria type C protein
MSLPYSLKEDLHAVGFDIFHPFDPSLYNKCIETENLPLEPLPEAHTSMAYLIGNTKLIWPFFRGWYMSHGTDIIDPFDTFCQKTLEPIFKRNLQGNQYHVYWSFESSPEKLVSMQRVASCSGFSFLDTESHLSIHPVYGTWHSFRAVVVVKTEGPNNLPTPMPVPCLLTPQEQDQAKVAMFHALEVSDKDRLCDQLHGNKGLVFEQVAAAWIELRDCVSVGKEFKFDKDQLWYHYTKDTKFLHQ